MNKDNAKNAALALLKGEQEDLLDDIVWDCAESMISSINNSGFNNQIDFIIEQVGPELALEYVKGVIE